MKDNSVVVIIKATGNKTVIDQGDFNSAIHEYDYPMAKKGGDPIASLPDDELDALTDPEA